MRLSAAIQSFNTQLQGDGKSKHTRSAYTRDLKKFKGWLNADPAISRITPDVLARYLASSTTAAKPAISVNRTKTALRVFFQFLTDVGYLGTNPARLIKNGRTQPKIPEHLAPAETRRLVTAIPAKAGWVARRDRVMFSLLLQTGIRLGSLVNLTVSDVHLADRSLKVNGKGGTKQSVYLNCKVRRSLRSYVARARLNPDDPLFPSQDGGPLCSRQVQLRFKHWLDKAGITRHLTVHCTRHTFAMNLYRQSGNLRLVQTALGHRHISTTEIYARVEDKALRRALEKL